MKKKRSIQNPFIINEIKKQKKNRNMIETTEISSCSSIQSSDLPTELNTEEQEENQVIQQNKIEFKKFNAKEFLEQVKNILEEEESLNMEKFNELFDNQIVPILNQYFAFVEEGTFFLYISDPLLSPQIIKKDQLDLFLRDSKIMVTIKGKMKKIKTSKQWRSSTNKKKYEKMVFDPSNTNPNNYNLFRGWKWKKFNSMEEVDFDKIFPVINHIKKVWANDDDYCNKFITEYLADIFQNPSEKNPIVLQLYGDQGTGKSLISQTLMGALLGIYHGVCNNLKDFFGKSSSYLKIFQKLLIVWDECGDYQYKNPLKISNKIEKRVSRLIDINIYSRQIIEINTENFMKIEKSSIYCPLFQVSNIYRNNEQHFKEIVKITKDEDCLTHLFNYFLFTPRTINFKSSNSIPKTQYRNDLQIENQIPEIRWILDRTELVEEKEKNPECFKDDVECCKFQVGFNDHDMGNSYTELGYIWKISEECWVPSQILYKVIFFILINNY